MAPEVQEGDTLFVRSVIGSDKPREGDMVVALLGNNLAVGYLHREGAKLWLVTHTQTKELAEAKDYIEGVVVGVSKSLV